MLLHGAKRLLLPLAMFLAMLVALFYTKSSWQVWTSVFEYLPYWFFSASALLAAQFNRSRISLMSLLLMFAYGALSGDFAISANTITSLEFIPNVLHKSTNFSIWLLHTLLIWCVAMCFMKDRGLLSPHLLTRILVFGACILVAGLWVYLVTSWFLPNYAKTAPAWLVSHLLVELFVGLLLCVILVRTSYQYTLVNAAMVISFGVCFGYFTLTYQHGQQVLPLSVIATLVASCFIIAIFVDSYFLAYRDELTALPSRRALNQLALSLGRHYSVAMMDVDHFKKFNDTYGHDIGDQVLKMVAQKLARVSGGGKVFRYGGEEFTVVFPRKSVDQVTAHLNAVREVIANYQLVIREDERKTKKQRQKGKAGRKGKPAVSVTISMGVVNRVGGESFEQALKRADQALYKAKKSGRNCVVAA